MKSVLISIQPKWCELIASGKKTIEVRKTRPKLETPFKCYIYATKSGNRIILKNDRVFEISKALTGKVICEFVCDEIIKDERGENADLFTKQAGLSLEWQKDYGKNKPLYGWHISDLKIYDKPKELCEFVKECDGFGGNIGCRGCKYYYSESNESIGFYDECCCNNSRPIERPPQSWCYVEWEAEKALEERIKNEAQSNKN